MTFYEKFLDLCKQKGMSPAAVVREIGLNNSSSTAWKRGSVPKTWTLKKLADYFGVSIDHLLGDDLIEQMYNMGISHIRISDGQPLSHEAMLLAEDYESLDYWGRKQLRTTADVELERVHFSIEQSTAPPKHVEVPSKIPRYKLQDLAQLSHTAPEGYGYPHPRTPSRIAGEWRIEGGPNLIPLAAQN